MHYKQHCSSYALRVARRMTLKSSRKYMPFLFIVFTSSIFRRCTYASERAQHCACETREFGPALNCHGAGFTEVPQQNQSLKVSILYLQFNLIRTIRSGDFVFYSNLTELYLQGNKITDIGDYAFAGLQRLRVLDLSHNLIKTVRQSEVDRLSRNLEWISLAMNSLLRIPSFESSTKLEYLNASNNRFMREIHPGSFPTSLVELDLHYTGIRDFRRSSFQNLHNLKSLSLHDNMASASVTFGEGVFDDLVSVERLDLSRCYCKTLPRNSFVRLANLKGLLLNNCWLSQTPITDNPSLEVLDMSNNRRMAIKPGEIRYPASLIELRLDRTVLSEIRNDLFRNLTKLKTLDVCRSKVRTIESDAFIYLDKISELCFSGNPLEVMPRLPASLKSVNASYTKITRLDRTMLAELRDVVEAKLMENNIEHIQEGAFENMTSLLSLDLSLNKLRQVERSSFDIGHRGGSEEVQSALLLLNLSFNSIKNIEPGAFSMHRRLRILDLQSNLLTTFDYETLRGLKRLATLKLNLNDICDIKPYAFKDLTKLEVLDLEENALETLHARVFAGMVALKELRLGSNKLLTIPNIVFPSLRYFDVSFNRLKVFPLVGGTEVREVRASHNPTERITEDSLRISPNLEFLDASYCKISSIDYKAFYCTPKLRELDLTGNRLTEFVSNKMPSLESLKMGENHLSSIERNVASIAPKIRTLSIGYNRFHALDPSIFAGASFSELDLSGNLFQCDCELQPLAEWIKKHLDVVRDSDFYLCEEPKDAYAEPILDAVQDLQCVDDGLESKAKKEKRKAPKKKCSCTDRRR